MFDLLAQTTLPDAAPSAPTPSGGTPVVVAPVTTTTSAPGGTTGKPAPPPLFTTLQQLGPILIMVVIFLFLMNRSKKKTDKGRTDMLSQLKKGDEVQTIGGILGKVMEAREDKVLVKVDENSNTKIWFSRTAIHRVVGADEVVK
jgi:preprotein translocase subunit YajC